MPRRGFALLAVLWLVVAIAGVALEFSLQARERRSKAIDLAERGQAYAAAIAGLQEAKSRLDALRGLPAPGTPPSFVPDPSDPWWRADSLVSGTGRVGEGGAYTLIVHDATAMVNINVMWEGDWRTFLTGLGIDYDTADRLAQAIMDWRDPDNDARPRGAERAEYIRAGHVVLPANRDFANVAELRDVLGMTPEIYARIAPYATIGTETRPVGPGISDFVNVNSSDPPVLRMLPGFTDDVIAAVMSRRSQGRRFNSIDDVIQTVGGSAGEALRQQQSIPGKAPWFNSTDEILVKSIGWAPGGHTHVTLEAVLKPNQGIEFIREE